MSILCGKDVLRTDHLSDEEVELILSTATRFERVLKSGGRLTNMEGQILAALQHKYTRCIPYNSGPTQPFTTRKSRKENPVG